MNPSATLDIVCPTSLASSGVEVLATRVARLFPHINIQLWGVGHALVAETSGDRITRAPLDTILEALGQRSNSAPLIVMGLPESTEECRRLIAQLERRGDRSALMLERPGRTPIDVGADVNVEGVKNLITLNMKYSKSLRSRYPLSRIFRGGLALPNEFFEREDSIRDNLLVFTGRATDSKGFSDLLGWWSESHLRNHGLRLKVNIIGTMPAVHAVAIEHLGIELSTLRGIDERGRSAGEALACIFPARDDHLPQSLLECMASRGLVVCTHIPGHSDVVRHGRNGLLVQKRLRDLEAHIVDVRQNVGHCMNMRHAARHTAWEAHGSEPSRVLWGRILGFVLP